MGKPRPAVERIRQLTHATTRSSANATALAANTDEQAYMAIILSALRRSRWKSIEEERSMLLAVQAITAIACVASQRRHELADDIKKGAQSATDAFLEKGVAW